MPESLARTRVDIHHVHVPKIHYVRVAYSASLPQGEEGILTVRESLCNVDAETASAWCFEDESWCLVLDSACPCSLVGALLVLVML